MSDLARWRLSGELTPTRTNGEIAFRKNGSSVDIWIRIDGTPSWFGVDRLALSDFLNSSNNAVVLQAQSDGNAEIQRMEYAMARGEIERYCNVKFFENHWACNDCGALTNDPWGHNSWHDAQRREC